MDESVHAAYFEQAKYGINVREALIYMLMKAGKGEIVKQIDFIQNGTVIDHIKAGEGPLKVLEVLQMIEHISQGQCKVMIGCNFDSGVINRKDIIKISGGFLTQKEVNQVSLIAPSSYCIDH